MTIQVLSNEPKVEAPAANPAEAKPEASKDASLSALGEQSPEQKVTEESETSEPEAKETETEESESHEEVEGDPEAKDQEKEDKPKNKKTGFERRVRKLNAQKAALEQEKEYWKQEALKNATSKPETKADTKPSAEESAGRPKENDFKTHEEWLEAMIDWKSEQKIQKLKKDEEKSKSESERKTQIQSYKDRIQSFKETHDDFEDMVENLAHVPRSAMIEHIIVTSQNGPELLYELGKNPEEAIRIAKLPPAFQAVELGKISAKIAPSASAEKPKEQKTITSAPKPIAPVGGGGKAIVPKTLEEAASKSYADYKKLREQELKKRRQA